MKLFLLILSVFVLSACSKDNSITEVEPPPSEPAAPPDSAQIIYVTATTTSGASTLYAYRANRQELWKLPISGGAGSGRAISDSLLYMSVGQRVYALNAQTGVIKWTFPFGTSFFTALKTYGDTLVTAASKLAPSSNNQLVLLNKNTGLFFWTVVVIDQPVVSPVMSDGKIYALTTNSTGTELNLAAYDLATSAQVWKKPIAAGFLTAGLPEMIVRGDTLIMGAFGSAVTLLNKHTGTVYWSKGLNTSQSFIINNEIVYHDQRRECVFKISLATGVTTFQGQKVRYGSKSYVYDNHFYTLDNDSLFRTNLSDGTVRRTKIKDFTFFSQLLVVGNTVYASKIDYNVPADESRIMMLRADDLEPKDSIVLQGRSVGSFNVLSTSNRFH